MRLELRGGCRCGGLHHQGMGRGGGCGCVVQRCFSCGAVLRSVLRCRGHHHCKRELFRCRRSGSCGVGDGLRQRFAWDGKAVQYDLLPELKEGSSVAGSRSALVHVLTGAIRVRCGEISGSRCVATAEGLSTRIPLRNPLALLCAKLSGGDWCMLAQHKQILANLETTY